MKNLLFILMFAVAALFAAPDVGATANRPVKRYLKALTETKTQPVATVEQKTQPPCVELAEQKEATESTPNAPAPYDPGWQFLATDFSKFYPAQNLASLTRQNSGHFVSALPPRPEPYKICNPPRA